MTENQFSQEIIDKFERFVYTSGRRVKNGNVLEEYIKDKGQDKTISELSNEELYMYILGLCQKKA